MKANLINRETGVLLQEFDNVDSIFDNYIVINLDGNLGKHFCGPNEKFIDPNAPIEEITEENTDETTEN